jgi:hypothetical protein
MGYQFHQPLASRFVSCLDEHGADRVEAEGFLVALPLFYEWW